MCDVTHTPSKTVSVLDLLLQARDARYGRPLSRFVLTRTPFLLSRLILVQRLSVGPICTKCVHKRHVRTVHVDLCI